MFYEGIHNNGTLENSYSQRILILTPPYPPELTDPIVSFTLARYPSHYPQASIRALAHLGFDRWPLAHTPGLSFWRLLGVGRGRIDPLQGLQK